MPAPDNLVAQTPGQPITPPTAEQSTTTSIEQTEAKEPEYTAKHNGGGRYRIFYTPADAEHGDWFSDFVATGEGAKDAAQAEADRLNAGGEPFFKPEEQGEQTTAAAVATQPTAEQAAAPRTAAVLTPEGWLVPELPARKE